MISQDSQKDRQTDMAETIRWILFIGSPRVGYDWIDKTTKL